MLQRPGTAEDIQEVMQRLLRDPARGGRLNATMGRVKAVQGDGGEAAPDEDPFARLLADPASLTQLLQDPGRAQEMLGALNGSALFEEMQELGGTVLEQLRIAKLDAGAQVEVDGLRARPELNGLVGELKDATPEEAASFEGRRIVEVEGGERLALRPENLVFPRHRLGDAVTLDAEFGYEEEGLEGRSAVVSELTQQEEELGFQAYAGRVVVDVLPLLPGGPVLHRLLMWPEHLRPRPFQPGDGVELAGLDSDARLNGLAATVVPAAAGELAGVGPGHAVVTVDSTGERLLVRRRNALLTGVAPPGLQNFG